MKKLLLGSAAVIGLAALSAPASAQDLKLGVGGHFKGYAVWHDQDTDTAVAAEDRSFDILRETEMHFSGETTLDNGLTVGVHVEADVDSGDSFDVDESYAYFSGAWGRVNFGDEDGAAYLLQVAAPSADSNVDGLRQFVNPVNYTTLLPISMATVGSVLNLDGLDYDNDATGDADKFTYLTPILNGFQAGVSYTPDVGGVLPIAAGGFLSRSLGGVTTDDVDAAYGHGWELAARYEGQMDELGFSIGGGYTNVDLEEDGAFAALFGLDDFSEWNAGLDLNWGAFGLGVVYSENNNGLDVTDENETWVVGLDYTTGAFKIGGSYLNNDNDTLAPAEIDTDRWTGGVVYTYGPGMSFRGSLSYVEHEIEGVSDVEATSLLMGTQIRF